MKGDWHNPDKAIIVAVSRGGGTFLCNCLDNHPLIGCEREDPLNFRGPWRRLLPEVRPETILELTLSRPGYRVAMCKLSYRQMRIISPEFWHKHDVKMIHLYRENVLRVIISAILNTMAVQGQIKHPNHSFGRVKPFQMEFNVDMVLGECKRYVSNVAAMKEWLRTLGRPLLEITYKDIVGGEGKETVLMPTATADKLCDFLNVPRRILYCELKRVNGYPLSDIVTNWNELKEAIQNSEFAECLKDEAEYIRLKKEWKYAHPVRGIGSSK